MYISLYWFFTIFLLKVLIKNYKNVNQRVHFQHVRQEIVKTWLTMTQILKSYVQYFKINRWHETLKITGMCWETFHNLARKLEDAFCFLSYKTMRKYFQINFQWDSTRNRKYYIRSTSKGQSEIRIYKSACNSFCKLEIYL